MDSSLLTCPRDLLPLLQSTGALVLGQFLALLWWTSRMREREGTAFLHYKRSAGICGTASYHVGTMGAQCRHETKNVAHCTVGDFKNDSQSDIICDLTCTLCKLIYIYVYTTIHSGRTLKALAETLHIYLCLPSI